MATLGPKTEAVAPIPAKYRRRFDRPTIEARKRPRRHRREVSIIVPQRVPPPPPTETTVWTRDYDNYASFVGVLWITAVCDGSPQPPPSREDLCATLSRELKCSTHLVLRHCPWLHCPEAYWKPDPRAEPLTPPPPADDVDLGAVFGDDPAFVDHFLCDIADVDQPDLNDVDDVLSIV
mmetsp:Transcript_3058/g.7892  ORF Transcript_3058/g.7892 Transcript_3058/m.7892 type:complete len:178 (+) Transcript_3058:68-601(+)